MVTIELRFPGGRYHATPWDQNVNEGAVEWPPSPWRVLRALIAVGFRKAAQEVEEPVLQRLVETLAQALPSYHLPAGTISHLRHYMPLYRPKKLEPYNSPNTTKVFDSFLQLERGAVLYITWPGLTLEPELREALELLVRRLAYLGRAESWVEARLSEQGAAIPDPNVLPLTDGKLLGDQDREIRVLSAVPPEAFQRWRASALDEQQTRTLAAKKKQAEDKGKSPEKDKLTKKDLARIEAMIPDTIYGALHADTGDLQQQGWSRAPGARWASYVLTEPKLSRVVRDRRDRARPSPTVVRLAIASQVPPRLTEALDFCLRVRRALQANSDSAAVFSGHATDGSPLAGHQHLFILPEALGHHGRITHVTLYAKEGFDAQAQAAIDALCRHGLMEGFSSRGKQGKSHPTQVVLVGRGSLGDFGAGRLCSALDVAGGECGIFARSKIWRSVTPFIPTRHPKQRRGGEPKLDEQGLQIGSPAHDLTRLLLSLDFPAPARVTPLPHAILGGKNTPWLAFRTHHRQVHGSRGSASGYGFELEFEGEVAGPMIIGFGAHLGMGLFVPVEPTCRGE